MTRLDENRAKSQIANKAGCAVGDIKRFAIWGNHSSTMYPDYTNAVIGDRALTDVISDHAWLDGEFIKTVQKRGASIIQARGKSSAASAAWAAIKHARDWARPTPAGEWVSMAVTSDGSYGIPEGLIYSFPCTVDENGRYEIVQGVELNAQAKARAMATADELVSERETVADLLG
jgi:malate dehydrogenase